MSNADFALGQVPTKFISLADVNAMLYLYIKTKKFKAIWSKFFAKTAASMAKLG